MTAPVKLICLVIACVLFFIAMIVGYWTGGPPRLNLMAGGLFFYALKDLFPE